MSLSLSLLRKWKSPEEIQCRTTSRKQNNKRGDENEKMKRRWWKQWKETEGGDEGAYFNCRKDVNAHCLSCLVLSTSTVWARQMDKSTHSTWRVYIIIYQLQSLLLKHQFFVFSTYHLSFLIHLKSVQCLHKTSQRRRGCVLSSGLRALQEGVANASLCWPFRPLDGADGHCYKVFCDKIENIRGITWNNTC